MDKPWKQFERRAAKLIKGERMPANSGGKVDVRSVMRYLRRHRPDLVDDFESMATQAEYEPK